MRMLLRKLRVDDYLGLVAASSVIRPGVAKSGMMRQFILRHRFPEKRKDIHPVMLDIMPETYGVMVYQEDVIKVAHYYAGLTLGEADVLRRGMSGKFRSREEFGKAKDAFFTKAIAKGHPPKMVSEVWMQVESFAGYAFSKGHSASYAVESYQSLFLKAYYPIEYMVATINNFGGFYRTELYVHEAQLHGAKVEAPCVNHSGAETVLYGKTMFLGFGLVRDLEHRVIADILKERSINGPFKHLNNFIERIPISIEQLSCVIRTGAFRFSGKTKKELLWQAHFLLGHAPPKIPTGVLFKSKAKKYQLPALYSAPLEDAFSEMELLGFPLCDPFMLLDEEAKQEVLAKDIANYKNKVVTIVGYLVTIKKTKTSKGEAMYFGTLLDREGQWLDTVHFPPYSRKYPFRGRGIYEIKGKVLEEFDCYNVEVSFMRKLPIAVDPRYADVKMANRERLNDNKRKSLREFG
jgi:DNA polymerase-3 subunit alpha